MSLFKDMQFVGPVGSSGKRYKTTLRAWMAARESGEMIPNPKNRAIDKKHVDSMKEDFDFNSFTTITAIEIKNKDGSRTLQQRTGHHKYVALSELKTEGLLGSDIDYPLYIDIISNEDAVRAYVTEGNSKRLQLYDLLNNDDYAFSVLMKRLLGQVDLSPYRGVAFYSKKAAVSLASIILTVSDNKTDYKDVPFRRVCRSWDGLKKQAKLPLGDSKFNVVLKNKHKEDLYDALVYAIDVFKNIIDSGDLLEGTRPKAALSEQAKAILDSKRFFAFLIWDRLIGGQTTKNAPEHLARCLTGKDYSLVNDALNALNSMDSVTFSNKIYSIARTKTGWKKELGA